MALVSSSLSHIKSRTGEHSTIEPRSDYQRPRSFQQDSAVADRSLVDLLLREVNSNHSNTTDT